ncbi:MAG TPA: hypothetical protein VM914_09385 [Pyrinomonadaceae bacterium]|nr:hypothetical protein [Pyrinomonadaceae bacterium]
MTLSLAFVSTTSRAASGDGDGAQGLDPTAIVRAFTRKETEFRRALNGYMFRREAVVQTVGFGGQVTGEYARTSSFTFNDAGERFERITYFPMPTLTEISFTQEDLEDLGGVQPFALEASKIDQYNFTYVGREKIDEIGTYVFDVAPKVVPKKVSERFFQGRVWVDDRDLQIVKVKGKGVPEGKQRFPTFETYREQIDGKYWFPTYTYADDELDFSNGQVVHVRMKVRYTDYKRFQGRVRVIEEGEPGDVPDEPQTPPQQSKPKPYDTKAQNVTPYAPGTRRVGRGLPARSRMTR